MPRNKGKSARAKLQHAPGTQGFITAPYISDSASVYTSDSEWEESSSDESETAVRQLFAKCAQQNLRKGASLKQNRSNVYTKDSRTTKYRKAAEWREASKGCGNLAAMFTAMREPVPDLQMKAEDDVYDTSQDLPRVSEVGLELDLQFDFLNYCMDQMDRNIGEDDEMDNWDNDELWVPWKEDDDSDDDSDNDDAWEAANLPADPVEVPFGTKDDDIQEWLDIDDTDEPPQSPKDILEIIKTCFKTYKNMKSGCTIKMFTQLTAVAEYVKLRDHYRSQLAVCKRPCTQASQAISHRMGKGPYFARQICYHEHYLIRHQRLPPSKASARHGQFTLLDNKNVCLAVHRYLAAKDLGTITPDDLCRHVNGMILPALGLTGPKDKICHRTTINWLHKLGYVCKDVVKGVYFDGHECPDVITYREKFLKEIATYEKLMCTYDDETMEPVPPLLAPGEHEHVFLAQDECIFHVNEGPHHQWLKTDQQPLKKKGNGRSIHVSGWICETIGQLQLSEAQLEAQASLPEAEQLKVTNARKTIYPGKNHDAWWDLDQLAANLADAVDIFEYTQPGKVTVFLFDCSSAHEGLALNALNVNNMNVGPGDLRNKPKGMHIVLEERVSVWDELVKRAKGGKPIGKCKECTKSQVKKDAERRVAEAEAMGHEDVVDESEIALQNGPEVLSVSDWCCMHRVLSLQDDFANEKPMLQEYIEKWGHVCIFLPKFHCYCAVADGRFPTARLLVQQSLDMCEPITVCCFFRKMWWYLDAYRKGLNPQQTAFAVKLFKSHRHVGLPADIIAAM
ncbi:hypothetical protein FIBSPDRAFT_900319 [Athelia psychrophila]|uniref:Uncharacterized protein n=1 Tax=Athelia psychrophila TaxID=1759441 RepID=A0A165YK03_9AGAM|nr:hypothetical protein FIBSPDRAFT_900319 [Fibularhizoctonia sp. CBS 109695]